MEGDPRTWHHMVVVYATHADMGCARGEGGSRGLGHCLRSCAGWRTKSAGAEERGYAVLGAPSAEVEGEVFSGSP